jgi:hypothetical protein
MPEYLVTYTSMVIEADDEDAAIDRAGDMKGGGNWEAEEVVMGAITRDVTHAGILLSSGKYQFLNRAPWATVETLPDGTTSVNARHTSKREADEYLTMGPSWTVINYDDPSKSKRSGPEHTEWDPIAWDAEPLHNPGNPILADLREGDDLKAAVQWWWSMTEDILSEWDTVPPYVHHARRVLHLLRKVVMVSD